MHIPRPMSLMLNACGLIHTLLYEDAKKDLVEACKRHLGSSRNLSADTQRCA